MTTAPEPGPLNGQFEPAAEAVSIRNPRALLEDIAAISMAISLKRIADAMTGPVNAYGETMAEAIPGEISRAIRSGAFR